jgi:CTP:phosphocholine cytidylyltransferase-like protein
MTNAPIACVPGKRTTTSIDAPTQDAHSSSKKALPQLLKIHSTRAMAFIIKGLHYIDSQDCQIVLEELAKRMALMYKHEKNNQWFWFERYMTYANGPVRY